jgi:Zn-dependent membrane protease YugP
MLALFDPLYLVITLISVAVSGYATWKVRSAFNKYSQVGNVRRLTGAEVAAEILRYQGIHNVRIEPTEGMLSDHYDPSKRVLRLSPDVYNGTTIAAAGVAAHEVGHAIQHAREYPLLQLRTSIVSLASISSWASWIIIIMGFFFMYLAHNPVILYIGIGLFSVVVFFQLITVPVEVDASNRAKALLLQNGLLDKREMTGIHKVLNAAALTYVAAAFSAILQLLYLLLRAGLLGGDE